MFLLLQMPMLTAQAMANHHAAHPEGPPLQPLQVDYSEEKALMALYLGMTKQQVRGGGGRCGGGAVGQVCVRAGLVGSGQGFLAAAAPDDVGRQIVVRSLLPTPDLCPLLS